MRYNPGQIIEIITCLALNIYIYQIVIMCRFSIPFSGDPESLLKRARREIERAGGAFDGGSAQGSFQAKTPLGSIHGSYEVTGQEISLAIIKKPFILSCARIQKELAEVMH